MSNLQTNKFQGDVYISASSDPSIYGTGNLNIDGNLSISGTLSSTLGSTFSVITLNGSTSGSIAIKPQAIAGTYNFNMPITSGTSGQVLTSGAGMLSCFLLARLRVLF